MASPDLGGTIRRTSGKRSRAVVFVLGFLMLAVYAAVPAFAVHDEEFELDGNVTVQTKIDWASLFDANGAELGLPTNFTASGFDRDFVTNSNGSFNTSDTTTYATGSKDTLPISGWQCNYDNNVNSKIDVMNAYATAYTDPVSKDQIIYFALERNANTGDANVGFWFLQDEVGCETTGAAQTFSGEHRDGDLLIVSAFTSGGDVSTINVYRWNGGASGSLGTTPVASGVDCRADTTLPGDAACATANTEPITTPWLTSAKTTGVGHTLPTSQFFEGGLNLTKSNLGGKCFNVFIGDTRSSQSLTATLFDYARGVIGECTSETVTTPSITAPTVIDADGVMSVTDSAVVTVTGVPSFSGTVDFYLCGPFDAAATTRCDDSGGNTGGVPAGSKPVTTSPATVSSDEMTITSAGRYCWRAEFSGDLDKGVPASSDSRESECFLITPRQSTLSTQAGAGPVDFGQPVTDTATLGNTANQPGTGGPAGSTNGSINPTTAGAAAGGKITFFLYGPDPVGGTNCSTLATGFPAAGIDETVSGNGTYGPVSFTPQAPGTYHWVASYSGNLPNTLSSSHNTSCNDANEDVIVRQIPTTIKTRQSWYPNDTATISSTIGNLAAGGSVAFSLYEGATCSGTAKYTQSFTPVGGNPTETFTTNNTTFNITTLFADPADTSVTYSWKVVYTPAAADTAHTGKQSACGAEHFSITYTNDQGPGTNLP